MESGKDPLMGLLEIAEDRSLDPDTRVRAYIGALPYTRPRLSAQVTLDATPKDGQAALSQGQLMDRMVRMLDRLAPPRPIEVQVIETESTEIAVAEPDRDV